MQSKRFQIKLSAILWAIFWIAVCLASFSIDCQSNFPSGVLLFAARAFAPFVVLGALFDRPWTELVVCIGVAAAYIAIWSAAIHAGFP